MAGKTRMNWTEIKKGTEKVLSYTSKVQREELKRLGYKLKLLKRRRY